MDTIASRRGFLFAAAAGMAHSQSAALTVGQVIERIKTNVGIPWRAQTVDNLIVGCGVYKK